MTQTQYELIVGSLLHDIGKVIHRTGDYRSHPESGYDFLKNTVGIDDEEILNQVRYHHSKDFKDAKLSKTSLAYIAYIADNISSACDRRLSDDNDSGKGFDKEMPLDSIFNLLNGNDEHFKYPVVSLSKDIDYPINKDIKYNKSFYISCLDRIKDNLIGIEYSNGFINSLIEIFEANLSFIPSSTSKQEVADISLFDHSKLTVAFSSCIYAYIKENEIDDFRKELFTNASKFYAKNAFLLCSMDISGIQKFVYNIVSSGALKALRSRSFYIEILMEHLIDTLLEQVNLSRANCIYNGGGHAYLILPNTNQTKTSLNSFINNTNEWFIKTFDIGLYVACNYIPCSANDLKNEPDGSYKYIFSKLHEKVTNIKSNRYTPAQILILNSGKHKNEKRECIVCHRTDLLDENDKCLICQGLERFSKKLQNEDLMLFVITNDNQNYDLPLPDNKFLVAETEQQLLNRMQNSTNYVRSYCKNRFYTGNKVSTKLWVADYKNGDTLEDLVKNSSGIERLAVMRADIDNLGKAFVSGFESEKNRGKYSTLSRTATFSRKISMFFKLHINSILENGSYFLNDDDTGKRYATIVYSGGDDIFIIGTWDDIIGFAVDLYDSFTEYSQGTLTISAGIGIYPKKYPVSVMATETGELENLSKLHENKNAITLFGSEFTYSWDRFINNVLEEKYSLIKDFFSSVDEYGKNFIYNLLDLMRNRGEKINIARYAYFLARMEQKAKNKELYNEFAKNMYQWIKDKEQCNEAILALYIYIYTIRNNDLEEC